MRRRNLKPDTRYRWNDPDLPVYFLRRWWSAEEYQKACQYALENDKGYIDYKDDPSYNWNRKNKNANND